MTARVRTVVELELSGNPAAVRDDDEEQVDNNNNLSVVDNNNLPVNAPRRVVVDARENDRITVIHLSRSDITPPPWQGTDELATAEQIRKCVGWP